MFQDAKFSGFLEEVSWFHLCSLAVVSQQSNPNTNTDVQPTQKTNLIQVSHFLQFADRKLPLSKASDSWIFSGPIFEAKLELNETIENFVCSV